MKRLLLVFIATMPAIFSFAQVSDAEKNEALQTVNTNQKSLGLNTEDINNLVVLNSYIDKTTGIRYVYLLQTYLGIPVYNQVQVITFRDNKVLSNAGGRIDFINRRINVRSGFPAVPAEAAVMTALSDRKITGAKFPVVINSKDNGHKLEFGTLGVSNENITAQLIWVPTEDGKTVHLAWQIYIIPNTSSDYWLVNVDAINNSILSVNNLTVYDNLGPRTAGNTNTLNSNTATNKVENVLSDHKTTTGLNTGLPTSTGLVSSATYRVVPFPAENPNAPGGTPALRTDPWLAAPGNATSLKWHTGAGGTDYNYTRGNNVWAYQDRTPSNNTGTIAKSASSTTSPDPLTFNFVPDFTIDPTQSTPVQNQQFNITNMFYWNNILHDVMYQYGFTEAAANFQDDNQGRGGVGNDHVNAEAQDGSGSNNGNFSTPADGSSGRMQMYLFSFNGANPLLDGDVDNTFILHEYGHGISNRLTGGGTSGCLGNAEQMGEGWSDYYALMFSQNWTTSNLNTGFTTPRGVFNYAINGNLFPASPPGTGARHFPYCTNFAVNSQVYLATLPSSPHDRGEIWCATLWDMTWNIIQQVGNINPDLYDVAGGGGNTIAMKLVTEGLKLQPCNPGFINGRDAILQADLNLYGGAYQCAIKEAFRRRGMGVGASQGSSNNVTDQVPSFNGGSAIVSLPTVTQPTCETTTGTIVVNATGSGTLEYSVDNGATWFLSAVFSGLAPANYNVSVRIQSNPTCPTSYINNPVVINAATGCCVPPTINTPTIAQTSCAVPTGSIEVNATGTGTLEYSIDNGISWQQSAAFSGLTPGNYNIKVRLQAQPSCFNTYAVNPVIIDAVPMTIIPTITPDGPTTFCSGGSVILTASAGTSYSWSNAESTQSITVTESGDYTVTVTNANVCPGTSAPTKITVIPLTICPADIIQNIGTNCTKSITTVNPTVCSTVTNLTWNLSGATTANSPAVGIYYVGAKTFRAGTTMVTYTAMNSAGYTETCSFIVKLTENVPPEIRCPLDKSVNADPGVCTRSLVVLGNPIVSDNCGVASVTNNAPAIYHTGSNFVTWTVTDNSGNTRTCMQEIFVADNQKPVITCPGNIYQDAGANCQALVTTLNPQYNDNCGVTKLTWVMTGVSWGSSPNDGINFVGTRIFNTGLSHIIYTAIDASGNAQSCSFNVIVTDNQPPVITCPPEQTLCRQVNNTYNIPLMIQTDNCDIANTSFRITGATNRNGSGTNAGGIFNLGLSTITWTVKDVKGNTSTCTTRVTILPTTNSYCTPPPLVERVADRRLIEVTGPVLSINAWPNPANNFFNLKVNSPGKEIVEIRMYDIQGKLLQRQSGTADQTYRFGQHVVSGTYIIEARQAGQSVRIKVVKQ